MLSKALLLLRFVLESNKTTHVWKNKQLHNSVQDQDCTGKTNFDDRLPRVAKSCMKRELPS